MEKVLTTEQLLDMRKTVVNMQAFLDAGCPMSDPYDTYPNDFFSAMFDTTGVLAILDHIDAQQARLAELDGLLTSASNHCNDTANERNDLLCNVAVLKQQQDRLLQALKHIVGCDNIIDAIALAKQAIYTTKEK